MRNSTQCMLSCLPSGQHRPSSTDPQASLCANGIAVVQSVPVSRVSGLEPHSVEAQGDESADHRAKRPRSEQQKLQEGIRILFLQEVKTGLTPRDRTVQ